MAGIFSNQLSHAQSSNYWSEQESMRAMYEREMRQREMEALKNQQRPFNMSTMQYEYARQGENGPVVREVREPNPVLLLLGGGS